CFIVKFEQMNIQIINGPNLNLLGVREKSIYGSADFESYLAELQKHFTNITINYYQSNVEGEIINKLHEVGFSYDGIVLNAGAYTHTSIAIADAIAAINTQVIEVHISNVYKREEFRHTSMLASNCKGVIAGFGMHSYRLAIESLLLKY
ncbi:MAG: 3-dehydroquinate dehydratase, partial [Mucilaginibacter sp.]|nr:3-dehydroquinate dehydratase [Mucilaginibacter sp.]